MTQAKLPAAPAKHTTSNPDCPFCPGKKEDDWTTHPGDANDAKILRRIMKNPQKLVEEQSGARPKDELEGRQAEDSKADTWDTKAQGDIYTHPVHGPYGNQAHHAISGNQIMSGEDIEKLIVASKGEIQKDTGYSVNNRANGVCLPSYPKKFSKKNATTTWAPLSDATKQRIAEHPMEAGVGQVHIGEHDIEFDPDDETVAKIHHTSYPNEAKKMLAELYKTSKDWAGKCPVCDKQTKGGKLPPPYRINKWLDVISGNLIGHITADPTQWVYFISPYARDYHYDVCPPSHHKSKPKKRKKK